MTWRDHAACTTTNTDEWFTESARTGRRRAATLHRDYCSHCPVLTDCATNALTTGETAGIRAGVFLGTGNAWSAEHRQQVEEQLQARIIGTEVQEAPKPPPSCPQGHLKAAPNLVAGRLRSGRLECLACNRARSYLRHHPGGVFEELADRYFREITTGGDRVSERRCPQGHLLEAPNLVPSSARRGDRECLACSRARAYARRNPGVEFGETADRYFRQITAEEAA